MAKLMDEDAATARWDRASCVRAAILAPRLPAELGHLVFGPDESQPLDLHLSGYEGCLMALRSEVRVLGALCGRTR